MLGRWDEEKRLHQQIQAPVKDLVLQQIAFKMHERRQTSLHIAEFREMVQNELKSRGFIEETPLLYDEIIDRSGLFRVDSQHIEFRHLLFQEFFAGRAISDPDFISHSIDDEWWKRAVVFYFGEHPNEIASLMKLANSIEQMEGERAFMAATTVGLALQACYFGHVDAKAQVYLRVIRAIVDARSRPSFRRTLDRLPIVLLVACFFTARESLALSNLKLFVERLQTELLDSYKEDPAKQDEVRLWMIIGLLQSGMYDLAHIYIERFKPHNSTLLIALELELILARAGRILPEDGRTQLSSLMKIVGERFRPVGESLIKQLEREAKLLEKEAKEAGDPNGDLADSEMAANAHNAKAIDHARPTDD